MFKTPDEAQDFDDGASPILARNKRFHKSIPIRQCGICRKTDHRTSDSTKCDGDLRCSRCLSTEHIEYKEDCKFNCWNCRNDTHASGSNICKSNREYVSTQCKDIIQKQRFNNLMANTPPTQRGMHRSMVQLNRNLENTYAASTKRPRTNSNTGAAAVTPSPPSPPPTAGQPANQTAGQPGLMGNVHIFTMAYVMGCLSEKANKGSFEKSANSVLTKNGIS